MSAVRVASCEVCRAAISLERSALGLKSCSGRCQQRYRRWRDPLSRREGQLLRAAGGHVFWNDHGLRERLGVDKAEASARLEALARQRGLEIAWGKDGQVHFIASVTRERRERFLKTREVKP